MINLESRRTQASDRDEFLVCRAQTVECACPDDCERDHGNE